MNKLEILTDAQEKLSKIPRSEWMEDDFSNGVDKCCAIGHLVRLSSDDPSNYSRSNCVDWHRSDVLIRQATKGQIARVNNNCVHEYQQKTIKGRVMAFLRDAIKGATCLLLCCTPMGCASTRSLTVRMERGQPCVTIEFRDPASF